MEWTRSKFSHVATDPSVGRVLLVVSNHSSQVGLLVADGCDLLVANAGGLARDSCMEIKVVNESLIGVDFNLDVIKFLLGLVLLSLQRLHGLQCHTNLGILENEFEVWEDVVHGSGRCSVRDGGQKLAFLAFHVHVDLLGNIGDPLLLVEGWVSSLGGRGEDFSVSKDRSALSFVRGVGALSDELADLVQDEGHGRDGRASTSGHDFFDLLDAICVTLLDKLGSGLVHRSDHLLVVGKLLNS